MSQDEREAAATPMITPEMIAVTRHAIRYLSSPNTPWSDEQVSAVLEVALSASPAPAASGRITYEPCDRDAGEIIVNGQSMRRVRPELTASGGLEAAVEAMENDPFVEDAHLAGTTQQDQRIRHYAGVALAALAAPAATGGEAVGEPVGWAAVYDGDPKMFRRNRDDLVANAAAYQAIHPVYFGPAWRHQED